MILACRRESCYGAKHRFIFRTFHAIVGLHLGSKLDTVFPLCEIDNHCFAYDLFSRRLMTEFKLKQKQIMSDVRLKVMQSALSHQVITINLILIKKTAVLCMPPM